jgi:S-formylglutathione hydrolase FrmB
MRAPGGRIGGLYGAHAALVVAAAAAVAATPAHAAISRFDVPAPALGQPRRTVRVYLPPSYTRPESAERRYPTVYLLHGWPGSDGNWQGLGKAGVTADSLIAHGAIPEVILVFPNGEGRGLLGRSLYMNGYDGRCPMEDYIVRDVVAWVDSTFRTRRDAAHRGVIGLSDGATGAFNFAFRHPDVFGACGGHSGQYRLKPGMGTGAIVGPEPGASRLLARYSPALSVTAERTFSIKAGLAASTVTPGATAPEESRTTPVRDACARVLLGIRSSKTSIAKYFTAMRMEESPSEQT